MGIFAVRERLWRIPLSPSQQSMAEGDHVRRGSVSRLFRLLLKLAIGLSIIALLLGVVWMVPVA